MHDHYIIHAIKMIDYMNGEIHNDVFLFLK